MSRYRWGNGPWINCLPNSKIRYESGSDSEENKRKFPGPVYASTSLLKEGLPTKVLPKEVLPKEVYPEKFIRTEKKKKLNL